MRIESNSDVVVSLPSDLETMFTRLFKHQPKLLFEAWTQPEHIRHWWGCDGTQVIACDVDLREGGNWRIVARMPSNGAPGCDGDQIFSGTYKEIIPGRRLVYSECYEAPQFGNPSWQTTVTFEQAEDCARLTHTILYASRDMRDMHLKFGMETGEKQSLARLDERLRQHGPDHTAQMVGRS